MRVKQIIKAEKEIVSWGEWKSGAIPKKAFPLSKARVRTYKIGRGAKWRIIEFSCLGHDFRLNLQINQAKQQFKAWLGMLNNRDITIVLRLEFHGTHPGWHVHTVCDHEIQEVPSGIRNGPWWKRIPDPKQHHSNITFAVTEDSAIDFVNDYLNLYKGRYELL